MDIPLSPTNSATLGHEKMRRHSESAPEVFFHINTTSPLPPPTPPPIPARSIARTLGGSYYDRDNGSSIVTTPRRSCWTSFLRNAKALWMLVLALVIGLGTGFGVGFAVATKKTITTG